jgi:hypothetical protein
MPFMAHDLPAGGGRLLQGATGYVATTVTGRRPGRLVRGARWARQAGLWIGENGWRDRGAVDTLGAMTIFVTVRRRGLPITAMGLASARPKMGEVSRR